MAFVKLIPFDRTLAGVVAPGPGARTYTEAELSEKTQQAYRQGVDAARAAADQQMVEFRAEVEQLSDGVLKSLALAEPALLEQLREALPGLAMEIARRLLAGFEPPTDLVERFCREALEQLFPEREGLELTLSSRDAEQLQQLNPEWLQRYPGLRVRGDAGLSPGDCLVRSRFGLIDARRQTKLAALERSLTDA